LDTSNKESYVKMMGESFTTVKSKMTDNTVNFYGTTLAWWAPFLIKKVASISAAAKKEVKTQPICSRKPPLSHFKP